ncbi:hypothetical protein EPUS_06256 [Endocarpon pusillum Z07020]|uniref:Uncharacterized protein n=1 Tax=Endocarpon pusillum (strain Z07020 / HMAS-L-300199) TaxID=1263415 RepID=U1FVG2_ENDPU|nr:uncharacterized protein EPUS_06256 [Endocarpon pusillum Z07020]ERF68812.1 hypothetical protein EPUS_06256 [Endocarpon pusillum Z07020]
MTSPVVTVAYLLRDSASDVANAKSNAVEIQVNSSECQTYFTARGLQTGGRYNPYPSNQSVATRSQPLQVQTTNAVTSPYANLPTSYDCYNGLYGSGVTRASYPTYSTNYDDEMYLGQAPAYMLPNNNESVLSTNSAFGPPASPRTWDVFSSSGRGQNGLYPDQNPSSAVSLTSGSFSSNCIPFTCSSHDVSTSLSGSSAIAASADRTLPNPATGRSQQQALIMAGSNSMDGLAISNIGYRNSLPWVGADNMSASSQSSDRIMSVSYGSTVDSNVGSGESSAATEDASFAYVPISQTSPSASIRAASTLPDPGPSQLVRKLDESAVEQRTTKTLSRESTPSPEHCMAEAYGYSGDLVVGRRSIRGSNSSGTLSNGQEYTRLRPLPIPTSDFYRSSQHGSADYQAELTHRTSIASLSGSGRY